jgi:hypothetical protein
MKTAATALLALCATIAVAAQVRVPNIPIPRDLPLPNIDRLLRGGSPITTSIADAYVDVPFLDRHDVTFGDLATLRNARGTFTLQPGRWAMDLQSFCFRPGTRGPQPTDGSGYLSAPIAGPHAATFAQMLEKYSAQRDIDQRDMQVLIWALLSRTKIRQMNPKMQAVAARVLTPAQIVALDSGALDIIPPEIRRRAFDALPREVRAVADAENRIRTALYRANHTYAELERIAVLRGPEPKDGRVIPRGRWSVHPKGFLVRYQPHGIARTTVHVVKPRRVQIARDGRGRIVAIDFGDGRRTEVSYNDSAPPFESSRIPMLGAHKFRSIRLTRPRGGKTEQIAIDNQGWTFLTRRGAPLVKRFDFFRAAFSQGDDWPGLWERAERYDEEFRQRGEWYQDRWDNNTDPPPDAEQAIRDLEDSEHLHDGIDAVLNGDRGDRLDWIIDNRERNNAALEASTVVIGSLPTTSSADDEYSPSWDVPTPGSASSQRGGLSSRGS